MGHSSRCFGVCFPGSSEGPDNIQDPILLHLHGEELGSHFCAPAVARLYLGLGGCPGVGHKETRGQAQVGEAGKGRVAEGPRGSFGNRG